MSDKTISPEIIKLMDKMAQNPTSRLFVPLAEEYLKCEMIDEAVIVLVEGIKNHPSYVAARVMLGKIYLQKNQIPEAQTEFEQVIGINPDNILAHKKLAMIYQGQGKLQQALESCKKVLMIDPSDKEAKGLVGVLELASASGVHSEAEAPSDRPIPTEPGPVNETEMKRADPASSVEPRPAVDEVSIQSPAQEVLEEVPMPVEPPIPSEEISFGVQEGPPIPSQEEIHSTEVSNNQSQEVVPVEPPPEAPVETPVVAEENGFASNDTWEGDKTVVAGFEIPSMEKEPVSEVDASSSDTKNEDSLLSTTLASLYMSQGHHQAAADVYQKLLARDPSDDESRQGLEKALHFLTSKQEAEKASQESSEPEDSKKKKAQRLQSWLDSIRKKNES